MGEVIAVLSNDDKEAMQCRFIVPMFTHCQSRFRQIHRLADKLADHDWCEGADEMRTVMSYSRSGVCELEMFGRSAANREAVVK